MPHHKVFKYQDNLCHNIAISDVFWQHEIIHDYSHYKDNNYFWTRNWSRIATHLVAVFVETIHFKKSPTLHHFKLDRDDIWPVCSSNKHASTDRVGFLTWRHTLAPMRTLSNWRHINVRILSSFFLSRWRPWSLPLLGAAYAAASAH